MENTNHLSFCLNFLQQIIYLRVFLGIKYNDLWEILYIELVIGLAYFRKKIIRPKPSYLNNLFDMRVYQFEMINKFYIILGLICMATAIRYKKPIQSHQRIPKRLGYSLTTESNGDRTLNETTIYDDGTTSSRIMRNQQIPPDYIKNFGFKDSNQTREQKIQSELNKHNQFRTRHLAPNLTVSQQLNKVAQAYAQKLYQLNPKKGELKHSRDIRYGENLYWESRAPDGGEASQAWYDEIKDYKWDGQFSSATGHFTQLIWKNSTQVGFGYAGGYIVANYRPPGNIIGRFKENVLYLKVENNSTSQDQIGKPIPVITKPQPKSKSKHKPKPKRQSESESSSSSSSSSSSKSKSKSK